MKRVRFLALAAMVMLAVAALAQQATQSAPAHKMPSAEDHLKMLSEKLSLTGEQQDQIRPIIEEMTDSAQKAMNDQSLTREERMGKVHAAMMKADKQAREFLTDEQKKTLDEMEQQQMHHGDMHGQQKPQQ